MPIQLPALDQNPYNEWPVEDLNRYHRLPYWLAENQAEMRRDWLTWPKLFQKKPWKANSGEIMRTVQTETAPIRRNQFIPSLIGSRPNIDIIDFGEREVECRLHRHRWASPHYSFYPSFADWFSDKFAPAAKSIERIKMHAEEAFYRTMAFQKAPWVWICGHGAVQAPSSVTEITSSNIPKSDNWILAHLAKCGSNTADESAGDFVGPAGDGTLTFKELWAINSFATEVLGMTPYSGTGLPSGMSAGLNEKLCLLTAKRQWNQFVDDPWVAENKPLDLNLINGPLKGDFWGMITSMLEHYGWRWKAVVSGGAQSLTWLEPEETEVNADYVLYGRTGPNRAYATEATHMLSHIFGGKFASVVDAGPPPSEFTSKTGPYVVGPMQWNGQVYQTNQFMIRGASDTGDVTELASSWNEYRRLQAQTTYGMLVQNHFNYLPIMHKMPKAGLRTIL